MAVILEVVEVTLEVTDFLQGILARIARDRVDMIRLLGIRNNIAEVQVVWVLGSISNGRVFRLRTAAQAKERVGIRQRRKKKGEERGEEPRQRLLSMCVLFQFACSD